MCPNFCFWDASENQHCGSSESVLDDAHQCRVHDLQKSMTSWTSQVSGVSCGQTNRQTGKRWWTYKDRQDILHQCFIWNTYMVMSALSKTDELLAHLYRSFDPRSRSGCITYIEQQCLSWSRSCHCFGQSKLEAASKHWPSQFSWHVHITRKTERVAGAAKHLSWLQAQVMKNSTDMESYGCCKLTTWCLSVKSKNTTRSCKSKDKLIQNICQNGWTNLFEKFSKKCSHSEVLDPSRWKKWLSGSLKANLRLYLKNYALTICKHCVQYTMFTHIWLRLW